jgi:UDP-N-acetylmuramoyl-L-alanyl-D-glutamate--2,6-diaminopimelate ligase
MLGSSQMAPSLEPPTRDEIDRLDALERDGVGGAVVRPTRAPFDWANDYFTVGVTGTNGKSSTTHLVAGIFSAAGRPTLLESTLGYYLEGQQLQVPRTARGYLAALRHAAQHGARHAAIEVTSAALAQGFARSWRFDLAVFTNLTRDHVEQHGSWEHYLASKAQLFLHLGPGRTAVLNACDPAAQLIERVTPADVKRRYYAVSSRGEQLVPAELVAQSVRLSSAGTQVELEPSETAEALGGVLTTRLVGAVFAENALAAALAALASGVAAADVARGLAACPVVPGRFEILNQDPIVAVDYAHTPDALVRTCETARTLARGKVSVVFGAGGGRDVEKREVMGRAVGERADYAFITTDNPRREDPAQIAEALARGCRRGGRAYPRLVPDRREAIRQALEGARPGDVVVVAGRGHERTQLIGDTEQPFSDVEEVERLLAGS